MGTKSMKPKISQWVSSVLVTAILMVTVDGIYARNMNEFQNDLFGLAKPSARPEKAFLIQSTGNLWTAVSNYGSIGDPNFPSTGRPSMMWPGGSNNSYLYDGGIWVGTELGGEPVVTTYFYNPDQEYLPTTGYPGEVGTSVNGAKAKSLEDSYVVFDDLGDRSESNHVPIGVRIVQRGLTWSLPDYDDMVAFEYEITNTGLNGDLSNVFIAFWYDVDVASIDPTNLAIDDLVDYDGWDLSDSETDIFDKVDPYDLDADGVTGYDEYGVPYYRDSGQNPNFDSDPAKVEPDGFYDEWGVVFDDTAPYLMWQADVAELGRVAGQPAVVDGDTLRGYQFPRSLSYIYDGDDPVSSSNDYGEREMNPIVDGFFGGMILGTDAASQTIEGRDYKVAYSHQWWNWESDPKTDQDRWDYINGQNVASQGKKFLNNPLELGFPQFDYRFLLSTGPFDIPEGESINVTFVTVIGRGLEGLRANADNAVKAYYSGSETGNPYNPKNWNEDKHWVLPIPPVVPALSYSPVDEGVKLAWDTSAETTLDPNLGRQDFEGYQLYRAAYAPQNWEMIASWDNRDVPVWVVGSSGDTLGDAPVNLPAIQQTFTDLGGNTVWGTTVEPPVNSIPYYYALTAYDPVKTAAEAGQDLPRAYSPLSNYKKTLSGAPVPVYPSHLYEEGDAIPNLDDVRIVPNPYLGTAAWEALYEDRLKIAGLPPVAKITIFSLVGDRIITIDHTNGTDYEFWDLVTRNNQSVVSGLYLYVVEAPDVSIVGATSKTVVKTIGKFAIFR